MDARTKALELVKKMNKMRVDREKKLEEERKMFHQQLEKEVMISKQRQEELKHKLKEEKRLKIE